MKSRGRNSNKSEFDLKFENGGNIARGKAEFLSDGAYFFENELEIKGVLTATVITCAAWLLELCELKAGEIFFFSGDRRVRPQTKHFGILYPPFSITRPCFENAKSHFVGIAATETLPPKFRTVPVVFETAFAKPPTSVEQVFEILDSGGNYQSIETNPKASLLSLKAKRLIDENYIVYPSIARVAARLGVTHEHLSRQFKLDFEMTPSAYLRQLRVADVPLKLARGEEIINISQEVGYNDLSRFYKQFRKTTKTSPGVCQTIMKPGGA